jgi:hypothetical protein
LDEADDFFDVLDVLSALREAPEGAAAAVPTHAPSTKSGGGDGSRSTSMASDRVCPLFSSSVLM